MPSGHLVATAASGLEEEVQQGVRVPVGNFAGRIAAEDRCVILEEVDHTKVVNPLLLDKGIRSLMGAPLRSGGKVIGVMGLRGSTGATGGRPPGLRSSSPENSGPGSSILMARY